MSKTYSFCSFFKLRCNTIFNEVIHLRKYVFAFYCLFLIVFVILKLHDKPYIRINDFRLMRINGYDNINIIPFRTVKLYINNINTSWGVINIVGNTLPFIILGKLFTLTFVRCRRSFIIICFFGMVIFFELIQYFFFLGVCDIDDVITNTMSLILGVFI